MACNEQKISDPYPEHRYVLRFTRSSPPDYQLNSRFLNLDLSCIVFHRPPYRRNSQTRQVLVSMLSTAYEAHFNAPLFYRELKDNTVPRYTKMVSASFFLSVATLAAVTAFGFLTFGGASSGYILNNYANSDRLAALARIFVSVSIVFSYPLCFVGLRDGIREMRGVRPEETKGRTAWTAGLVALTSAVSLGITDLGFVNSFCGALIGSAIVYIFPSMMILRVLRKKVVAGGSKLVAGVRREIALNNGIVVTGVVMGLLGAAISVLETFTQVLG